MQSSDEDHDLDSRIFNPESWTSDMMSVADRRKKFLCSMGFEEFISTKSASFPEHNELRLAETCAAALDSFPTADDGGEEDSFRCIKDLDNGKVFIVHEDGDNGLPCMLKELGSCKLLTFQEFEKLLGLSCSLHTPMQRQVLPSGEEHCEGFAASKIPRNWWRRLISKRPSVGMCSHDVSAKNSKISQTMRTKLLQHKKKCRELAALFIGQQIRAHEGLIRTMKFSPSGWHLASGGEDCIVRIWQISEVEASCKSSLQNGSTKFIDKAKSSKSFFGMKSDYSDSIVFPKKVFKITETPLQEFLGHTSEILDLSWSSSNYLLTSSMDKTVRMWKVGCDECLHVFGHIDYVTCIQFNPVDERYFISGSIDGKVRIWGISEHHVVDWVDIRDIVTAVCYRPDGKGFVVGSINGNCRFYDYLGNIMHLYFQFCIQGKQKLAAKRITGLQFSPDETQKVMITSADSRVRIFDGFGVVHKFRGSIMSGFLGRAKKTFSRNRRESSGSSSQPDIHVKEEAPEVTLQEEPQVVVQEAPEVALQQHPQDEGIYLINSEGAFVRRRGRATCRDVKELPSGTRVNIEVNDDGVPCNYLETTLLASYMGVIVKNSIIAPISFADWRNPGMELFKKLMTAEVEAKFVYPSHIRQLI